VEKRMFRPKMESDEYLDKFKVVLADHVSLYAIVIDTVRNELGLTDDRAVQAAAYTLWRQTTDTISQPGLTVWTPKETAFENLEEFPAYAEWYGDEAQAFVLLCFEYMNMERDDVTDTLREMEVTTALFETIVDYVAFANLVYMNHQLIVGGLEDDDADVKKQMVAFTATAFGQPIGKSVDDVIGGLK
jgi:hypothetical protein